MPRNKKKDKTIFVCQNCGYESPKWLGRCTECGEWSSFVEEKITPVQKRTARAGDAFTEKPRTLAEVTGEAETRISTTGIEFNRVLGGGIVPGSVVLVGGEPGIGKSTLMLQYGLLLAQKNHKVLYVSGEESARQTKMRATRIKLESENFLILPETNLDAITTAIENTAPDMVIIDSIQTTFKPEFESAPGSISQVRECALELIAIAKHKSIAVFIIGHVTKEGYLAGPKTLEHMVDTLLLFEGDRDHLYRILRSAKNRFGSTREIGVFEMTEEGLLEVKNPSALFLSERRNDISGSAVACILEGTRPILIEVQALVSPTSYGVPQRTTSGVDHRRVALLLAVLDKRIGLRLGTFDVFVNVAGGARIDEPAADLAIVTAVASSMRNKVVNPGAVIIGEVGLGGEIRAVPQIDKRAIEAEKMGFNKIIIPRSSAKKKVKLEKAEQITSETVEQALEILLA